MDHYNSTNKSVNLSCYNIDLLFEMLKNQTITLKMLLATCPKYTPTQEIVIGVVLSVLTCSMFMGNLLIIVAVSVVRRLQTPSNLLIVNLAVSDLLVSFVVLPFAIIFQLKGFWQFSKLFCDIFILSDVLLCTCSILSLCIISIDRYFAITKPLQYSAQRTSKRMVFMIILVWILAALISVPPLIGWRHKFEPGRCGYSDALAYQIYATFGAFYVPLFIMLFLYGKILFLAKRLANLDLNQRNQTAANNSSNTVLSNNNTATPEPATPHSMTRNDGTLPFRKHHANFDNVPRRPDDGVCSKRCTLAKLYNRTSWNFYRKSKLSSEVKAIKTLGIIMGCFTVCWCPFFLIQLITPILKELEIPVEKYINDTVVEVFLWLGYFNSFLNPVIYAKFNREFRTPFKELLLCRCRTINRRMRSESYIEQYGILKHRHSTPEFSFSSSTRRPTKTRDDISYNNRSHRK